MIPKLSSIVTLNLIANLPFLYHKPEQNAVTRIELTLIPTFSNPLRLISSKWRAARKAAGTASPLRSKL
jgi:hypothetical protein